jgi:FkbM family methyltransferase
MVMSRARAGLGVVRARSQRGAGGRATPADVANCYRYLLGREPDERGLRGFVRNIAARPTTRDELVEQFLTSEEFQARMHRLTGPSATVPERVDLHAGYHLYVLPDDSEIGAQLKRARAYEQKVSDRISALLSPGSVFVDVGASIGVFSIMAARLVGESGHVLAIEPGPQNRSLLLLNIASNGLTNVEPIWCAVDEAEGVLLYGQSKGNGFIQPFDGDVSLLSDRELVQSRTLDSILADRGRVDVVKIDVEGAEGRVFRGAKQLLEEASATIFFELAPPALAARSSMEALELLATVMDYGYRFDVLIDAADDLVDLSVHQILDFFAAGDLEHLDVVARPRRGA